MEYLTVSSVASLPEQLYSCFGDDPDLGEIVTMFVEEMTERVANFQRAFDEQNWDELCRAAHQLKGAAGSYGFDQLTPFAARLELVLREKGQTTEVREALEDLAALCRRVRSGRPS